MPVSRSVGENQICDIKFSNVVNLFKAASQASDIVQKWR